MKNREQTKNEKNKIPDLSLKESIITPTVNRLNTPIKKTHISKIDLKTWCSYMLGCYVE